MKEHGIQSSIVRKPVFAGSFYPSSKNLLSKRLENYFAQAKKPASDSLPQAIIAPHAGYVFSGEVAASAYIQLPENAKYKRVFILASSHRTSFRGVSVSNADFYETPLGKIEVDTRVTRKLLESDELVRNYAEAHNSEHSLEVQLPFLQHRLGVNLRIVPIIIGTHEAAECEAIAQKLMPWFTPENLFIISTDFSHYPAYDDAVETDFNTAQAICSNNPEELLKALGNDNRISNLATPLCGWTSVLTLLYLTQHNNMKFLRVQYRNSGDVPVYGEKDRVVGYWAIAVYNNRQKLDIPLDLQVEMLENARRAISLFLETGRLDKPLSSYHLWKKTAGIFVSIYVKGKLRGCIGNFKEGYPLDETLEQLAVSASCDERFESLKKEELGDLELEVSVLSPLQRIKSINEIVPGKHGIYIKKDSRSGTFLPKVAVKTGWTVEELLGHCARDKAGIGWHGWEDAEIYIYEAFVFKG